MSDNSLKVGKSGNTFAVPLPACRFDDMDLRPELWLSTLIERSASECRNISEKRALQTRRDDGDKARGKVA